MASSTGTPAGRGSGVGCFRCFRSFRIRWAAVSSDLGFHKERCTPITSYTFLLRQKMFL